MATFISRPPPPQDSDDDSDYSDSQVSEDEDEDESKSSEGDDPLPTRPEIMSIAKTFKPTLSREGGGYIVIDILSGLEPHEKDPFLLAHELPRKHYPSGEMHGIPLHPHRGFMECSYCKEFTSDDEHSTEADGLQTKVAAGGAEKFAILHSGDFELGKVGIGIEHEALVDEEWSGFLHFFLLHLNLPERSRLDAPYIQQAKDVAMPMVDMGHGASCKVLHGLVQGLRSPMKSHDVHWVCLDFSGVPNAVFRYAPPPQCNTRIIYLYNGTFTVEGARVETGSCVLMDPSKGNDLEVVAGTAGCDFLFLAGRALHEPVVQLGPFVMSSHAQLVQCFQDFQRGRLCPQPAKHELYETPFELDEYDDEHNEPDGTNQAPQT